MWGAMVLKKKQILNSKEREIIRIIHKKGGAMTPHEIAKETGMSYVTIKKYLKILYEKRLIVEVKK